VHPEVFELDKQARKCQRIENVSRGGKVANHAPLAVESPISEHPVCRDATYIYNISRGKFKSKFAQSSRSSTLAQIKLHHGKCGSCRGSENTREAPAAPVAD
jgi:hypothetical protein